MKMINKIQLRKLILFVIFQSCYEIITKFVCGFLHFTCLINKVAEDDRKFASSKWQIKRNKVIVW